MFDLRGIVVSGEYERGGRVRGACDQPDLESLCERAEGVPLSARVRRTAPALCILDRAGQRITGVTIGRIEDFGIKDSFNMGCAMAPAAAWTIAGNLKDFGRKPQDYDAIFTGDLGSVGQQALFELLSQENIDISDRHYDCGLLIYDTEKQE